MKNYQTPDYSKYSLDELYDVYYVVDRNNYPDNYKAIVSEIKKRKAELPLDEGVEYLESNRINRKPLFTAKTSCLSEAQKERRKYIGKIIILILAIIICSKLIYDYNVLGKYHDATWKTKSALILIALWAAIDLFYTVKARLSRGQKDKKE